MTTVICDVQGHVARLGGTKWCTDILKDKIYLIARLKDSSNIQLGNKNWEDTRLLDLKVKHIQLRGYHTC